MGRNDDEIIRKRSGWLVPVGILAAVVSLSAALLLYYLAPGAATLFQEQVSPTSDDSPIALNVHGVAFHIPANYLQYESARQGGSRREIALFALLPSLKGWSNWQSGAFADYGPDSRLIQLTLREDRNHISERDRLKRVYLVYTTSQTGVAGPYELNQFAFRNDTGYRNEDLFVGMTEKGAMVLRCERLSAEVPSPSCLRDTVLTYGVSLSYRFKRTHLKDWREIAASVDALAASFRQGR